MDVFLILDGVIINVVKVESIEQAQSLYAPAPSGITAIERTADNQHLNIGDLAP
jgi:hypothetical protein